MKLAYEWERWSMNKSTNNLGVRRESHRVWEGRWSETASGKG